MKAKSRIPAMVQPPKLAASAPRLMVHDDWTPPGQVKLEVGDVVDVSGTRCVVDMVNDCRARCIPMGVREVNYQTTGGKCVAFQVFERCVSISPNVERVMLLERRGESGLKEFFASKVARREVKPKPGDEGSIIVKKSNKTEKHGADGLPEQPYDRACCEELLKGGTPEEIAARVCKRFEGEKDVPTKAYRTNPKNYLKYHAEFVKDMTAAGLLKDGKAVAKPAAQAAPASPSVSKSPEAAKGAPAAKPEAASASPAPLARPLTQPMPAEPKKAGKAPKAGTDKKPIAHPRGGLAAGITKLIWDSL
ncbi:MAG: hypothetical protein KGL39_02760 [Patescibacteria group bacterium]|nr:hypothetical protein [Patescibacteria group bacterium]